MNRSMAAARKSRSWTRRLLVIAASLACAACGPRAQSAVYYVDNSAGADQASVVSETAAWRHAPGDPAAAGRPAAVKLQPGDVVRFKGGVLYRGEILLNASGSADKPIVYAGDQWGPQPAVFEGADPV